MTNVNDSFKDAIFSLLKFVIVIGPVAAVTMHKDPTSVDQESATSDLTQISSMQLLGMWLLYMLRGFNENLIAATYGKEADSIIFGMVVLRTIQIVNPRPYVLESYTVLLWLIPIFSNLIYMVFYDFTSAFGSVKTVAVATSPGPPNSVVSNGVKLVMAVTIAVWCVGRAALYQFDSEVGQLVENGTINAIYTLADAGIGVAIMLRIDHMQTEKHADIWPGVGLIPIIFLILSLVPTITQDLQWMQLSIAYAGALVLFLVSVYSSKEHNETNSYVETLGLGVIRAAYRIARSAIMNEHVMQLVYVACVAFICLKTLNSDNLMTTNVKFHKIIQKFSCPVVEVVDGLGIVKLFFDITNREEVRNGLLTISALALTTNVRNKLRSFVKLAYVHILPACVGFTNNLVIGNSLTASLSLLPLFYVCAFILTQMFAKSEHVLSRQSFWSQALVATAIHATLLFLLSDVGVSVWSFVPGNTMTRTISYAGKLVLIVEGLMGLICVMMMRLTSVANSVVVVSANADYIPEPKRKGRSVTSVLKIAVADIFNPALLLAAASIFLMVVAVLYIGSPLKSFRIVRTPDYYLANPTYMDLTLTDITGTLSAMAIPQVNMALGLALQLQDFLNHYACIGEVCIGTWFGGAVRAIVNVLGTAMALAFDQIAKLPGINSIDGILGKVNFLENPFMVNFNLFQSLSLSTIMDTSIPSIDVKIPALDFDISTDLVTDFMMYGAAAVAIILVLSRAFSTVFAPLAIINSLATSAAISGLIFIVTVMIKASRVMKEYQYSFEFEFYQSSWLYVVSLGFLFAALCVMEAPDEPNTEGIDEEASAKSVSASGFIPLTKMRRLYV